MSQLSEGFLSLPPEYQGVIDLAQEKYAISVIPLQELVGGWSGAMVYLVSVTFQDSSRIEHYVLKLDRVKQKSSTDEMTRHKQALECAPSEFAYRHMAEMAFDRVESDSAIAIFYAIAGQSLLQYKPLSRFERQSQIGEIFKATYAYLLDGWNEGRAFVQALHPQELLHRWLGFRLEQGGNIERFLTAVSGAHPDIPGFILQEEIFPNPLLFAREVEPWNDTRPIDILTGFIHGDLNTNNILVDFPSDDGQMEGYYLIDFALFKEDLPLLYDHRYLEMSYLILKLSQIPFPKLVDLLVRLGQEHGLDPESSPVELAGIGRVLHVARDTFDAWVQEYYPSLSDDLWCQYWLAGVAAGLAYCHKSSLSDEARLMGLMYAAANLKRCMHMFDIPGPNQGHQLYDPDRFALGPQVEGRTLAPSAPLKHNLPTQLTSFIGREGLVNDVKDLLNRQDVRLVTLSGPGGTGKTRLALKIAEELLDRYRDGVFFVSLTEVIQPELVASKIAQPLEVRAGGNRPLLENLKSYLQGQQMLIILDNFEHVLSAATMVAELLSAAPELEILVTSRVTLNLRGEHVYQVPPMVTPPVKGIPSIEDLRGIESIQLFLDRAQMVRSDFSLSEKNAEDIARICKRLDGLPLAIELASARLNLLSPQDILDRLGDRLKLLKDGARDLPDRQQALRKTIDWSYELLDQPERTLFNRLGIFVGGFDLEAAEAVCNPEAELDVLTGVSLLLNNSLLRQEKAPNGQTRFRMLETIREYALERVEAQGEMENLSRGYSHYYARKINETMGLKIYSSEATAWLDWIENELDNVEATLEWSQSTPEGLELGPPLIINLTWFWYRRGYFHEGRRWAERVLRSPAAQEGTLGRALALQGAALLAMWQADLTTARARADECVDLWSRMEEEHPLAMALMSKGIVLLNMGEDAAAHSLLETSQEIFKEVNDPYFYAITLVHLGNVSLGLADPEQALGWLQKAYALSKEIGDGWTISFALNNLGEVARVRGEYELADEYYQKSEALLKEMGDHGDLARLIHSRGYVALHKGNHDEAEESFRKALTMFRRLGNQRGMAECIAGLAGSRVDNGQAIRGAKLLGSAQALMEDAGASWWPADRVEVERIRQALQARLDDDFSQAWSAGRGLNLEEAVALAMNVDSGRPHA